MVTSCTGLDSTETFLTPIGTATLLGYSGERPRSRETFLTPMGTATTGMPVASASCCETFHTPTGTVTFAVIHRRTLRRNISYPYGDSNLFFFFSKSLLKLKHFIPHRGQKENRYVQLDISVFTLSALVIHMLRRPYRAPF